jgi:hypothetical protein
MHELKTTKQVIREDLNKDLENLGRKNQTEIVKIKSLISQIKNTV